MYSISGPANLSAPLLYGVQHLQVDRRTRFIFKNKQTKKPVTAMCLYECYLSQFMDSPNSVRNCLSKLGYIFSWASPENIAGILNFNLKKDGVSYLSDDALKLNDRVVRSAQTIVQNEVQNTKLRDAFVINTKIAQLIQEELATDVAVNAMGIEVLNTMVGRISADPETARALEAEARELILQEADDAVYGRRKSAVEQERLIKEAELQTDLSVQQKEQEIAESRVENEREILRGKAMTDAERVQASIDRETQRQSLVTLQSDNRKQESDTEAYAVTAKMEAFKTLPVENLKAMALANMNPEQLMAVAFESLAQNAGKIGELNITPDLFGNMMKKAVREPRA